MGCGNKHEIKRQRQLIPDWFHFVDLFRGMVASEAHGLTWPHIQKKKKKWFKMPQTSSSLAWSPWVLCDPCTFSFFHLCILVWPAHICIWWIFLCVFMCTAPVAVLCCSLGCYLRLLFHLIFVDFSLHSRGLLKDWLMLQLLMSSTLFSKASATCVDKEKTPLQRPATSLWEQPRQRCNCLW